VTLILAPQVILCGQENTGKSSVLERLCMFPAFPRSNGLTTRMPIELRLTRCTESMLRTQASRMRMEETFDPTSHYVEYVYESDDGKEPRRHWLVITNDTRDEERDHVTLGCQQFLLQSASAGFLGKPLIIQAQFTPPALLPFINTLTTTLGLEHGCARLVFGRSAWCLSDPSGGRN
jgi:hypothetical protein